MEASPHASVPRRRLLTGAAAALATLAGMPEASAQAYPTRYIRVLIATGTGTVSDITARLLSKYMPRTLGQPLVVEDIPSAGGVTGTTTLVRAPKDGYTLGVLNNNHVINPSIYKDIPFDTLADITPISTIGTTPLVLVVNPKLPVRTVQELLDLARSKPGSLTYGSAGNGSTLHLAGVLFTSSGKVDIQHIPYKASGQMVSDLLGGTIDMAFLGVAGVLDLITTGALRALAVTTVKRSAILRDVPTLAEQGLPGYDFEGWMLLAGPAGIPRPIVDRLNTELRTTLALGEVKEALFKLDVTPAPSSPEDAARFLKAELAKHSELARRGGATLD